MKSNQFPELFFSIEYTLTTLLLLALSVFIFSWSFPSRKRLLDSETVPRLACSSPESLCRLHIVFQLHLVLSSPCRICSYSYWRNLAHRYSLLASFLRLLRHALHHDLAFKIFLDEIWIACYYALSSHYSCRLTQSCL